MWSGREHQRASNLSNWNDRVAAHLASSGYDVDGFVADRRRIAKAVRLDRTELGDVRGLSLLHLQCHIGLDTLSWARLGAEVTGLDFSAPAIDAAREISRRSQTPSRFVVSDVYDAPDVLGETFDIVYASEGVLCWLPNVAAWAKVVRRLTRPGGTAFIRDGHPVFSGLKQDRPGSPLEFVGPYFEGEALRFDEPGTYVETDIPIAHTVTYEWDHGLGEIANAFIDAGFRIESLREHPVSGYRALPGMVKDQEDWWRLVGQPDRLPFMCSVRARRSESLGPAIDRRRAAISGQRVRQGKCQEDNMNHLDRLNTYLQGRLRREGMTEVTLQDAARWIREAELLPQSAFRRDGPLRFLIQAGWLEGGDQAPGPNGRYRIRRKSA